MTLIDGQYYIFRQISSTGDDAMIFENSFGTSNDDSYVIYKSVDSTVTQEKSANIYKNNKLFSYMVSRYKYQTEDGFYYATNTKKIVKVENKLVNEESSVGIYYINTDLYKCSYSDFITCSVVSTSDSCNGTEDNGNIKNDNGDFKVCKYNKDGGGVYTLILKTGTPAKEEESDITAGEEKSAEMGYRFLSKAHAKDLFNIEDTLLLKVDGTAKYAIQSN